jgi:hypothetical protein
MRSAGSLSTRALIPIIVDRPTSTYITSEAPILEHVASHVASGRVWSIMKQPIHRPPALCLTMGTREAHPLAHLRRYWIMDSEVPRFTRLPLRPCCGSGRNSNHLPNLPYDLIDSGHPVIFLILPGGILAGTPPSCGMLEGASRKSSGSQPEPRK